MSPQDQATYTDSCISLIRIINSFTNTLSPDITPSSSPDPLTTHLLTLTRALSQCALMKLYPSIDPSNTTILIQSATAVLDAIFEEPGFNIDFHPPPFVLATLCRLACETLAGQILLLTSEDENLKSVLIRTISNAVHRLTGLVADNDLEYIGGFRLSFLSSLTWNDRRSACADSAYGNLGMKGLFSSVM